MAQAARQHPGTKQSDAEYFRQLADQWYEETGGMSFLSKRIAHPAYHKVMAMGRNALPFLFREMRDTPDYWFWALHCITRESPVRPDATFDQTIEDWLTWGRSHGYID
jgi:hypothetical protein